MAVQAGHKKFAKQYAEIPGYWFDLAKKTGIREILLAKSRDWGSVSGEYIDGGLDGYSTTRERWQLSEREDYRLMRMASEDNPQPFIILHPDFKPDYVLAHEFGHHFAIAVYSQKTLDKKPSNHLAAALESVSPQSADHLRESKDELLAETIGLYLQNQKLTPALENLAKRTIAKLPAHIRAEIAEIRGIFAGRVN